MSKRATAGALEGLKEMSLTVVDGDFPRDVLASKNLQFAQYQMPARRNSAQTYDAKTKRGTGKKQGVLLLGAVDWSHLKQGQGEVEIARTSTAAWVLALASLGLVLGGPGVFDLQQTHLPLEFIQLINDLGWLEHPRGVGTRRGRLVATNT